MVRIAAFTGGTQVPSARFRLRQYVEGLRAQGLAVDEYVARWGAYPPKSRSLRPFWAMASLADRLPGVVGSYRYDATLLQREMISTLVTLEPLTHGPRILDVDDAIWLNRKGDFARRLSALCELVICGNTYLAEHFSGYGAQVIVLPTGVDTARFCPGAPAPRNQTIVWSGTSGGLPYLYAIEPALEAVFQRFPKARLRIVSDQPARFSALPADRVEFVRWSPACEVSALQDAALGLMPLRDGAWERGKCSYKLLTYLACGLPVVASPIGMNAEVLTQAQVGFGPSSLSAWSAAISDLLSEPERADAMGLRGRGLVSERYSLEALTPQLASALRRIAHGPEAAGT